MGHVAARTDLDSLPEEVVEDGSENRGGSFIVTDGQNLRARRCVGEDPVGVGLVDEDRVAAVVRSGKWWKVQIRNCAGGAAKWVCEPGHNDLHSVECVSIRRVFKVNGNVNRGSRHHLQSRRACGGCGGGVCAELDHEGAGGGAEILVVATVRVGARL